MQSEEQTNGMELCWEENRCSQKRKQTAWNCDWRGIDAVRRANKRHGFVLGGESMQSEEQTNDMELCWEGNRCRQKGKQTAWNCLGGNRCSQKSKQTTWNCVGRGIGAVRRANKRHGIVIGEESMQSDG